VSESQGTHRPRHLLVVLARPAISVAAVVAIIKLFLLPALHRERTNLANLVHINVAFLVAGVVLEVASLLAYARLTQVVLPEVQPEAQDVPKRTPRRLKAPLRLASNGRLSLMTVLRIDLSTFAISHLLPGGTVAGAALGYRLLNDEGISYTDASFALGAQGIGSAVVLNVILWAALIVSIPLHGVSNDVSYLYRAAAIVGALLLTLAGGLIFFLTIGKQWAARTVHRLAFKMPFLNAVRFEEALGRLADRLASLARDRRLLVRAVAWAAANWALDAASLWVFLHGFGVSVIVPYLLVAYGLAYVLAAIPITPAGLGVVETVLIVVLKAFGYGASAVGLGVLSYRVVNFIMPIPLGGASYLSLTFHRAVAESRGHRRLRLRFRHPEADLSDPPSPTETPGQAALPDHGVAADQAGSADHRVAADQAGSADHRVAADQAGSADQAGTARGSR